jgi:hypothetical protein
MLADARPRVVFCHFCPSVRRLLSKPEYGDGLTNLDERTCNRREGCGGAHLLLTGDELEAAKLGRECNNSKTPAF